VRPLLGRPLFGPQSAVAWPLSLSGDCTQLTGIRNEGLTANTRGACIIASSVLRFGRSGQFRLWRGLSVFDPPKDLVDASGVTPKLSEDERVSGSARQDGSVPSSAHRQFLRGELFAWRFSRITESIR
jgi:hypothetical protein